MNEAYFVTLFFCRYCDKEIQLRVYRGQNNTFPENEDEVNEAREWGEHFHWIDNHRRCAVCGELVISGKQETPEGLNLLINDGLVDIHPKYVRDTLEKERYSRLLTVHTKCMQFEKKLKLLGV